MKVILGIFAVITTIYIIHFSISYINRRKESFTDDEDEHFTDKDGGAGDSSYKFGMKLLKLVDEQADALSLDKKTKAEVVKELFTRTDELKKLSDAEVAADVEKTAEKMKAKAETFEEGGEIVKVTALPEAEAPKPVTAAKPDATKPEAAAAETAPVDVKPPVGNRVLPVEDEIKTKIGLVKNHLKEINTIVETIVPSEPKKGLMSLPTLPIPSLGKPVPPPVKEGFTGFENHVAAYASWE